MEYQLINVNNESKVIVLYVNIEGRSFGIGKAVKMKSGEYHVRFNRLQVKFLMETIVRLTGKWNRQELLSKGLELHGKFDFYFYLGFIKDDLKEATSTLVDFMDSPIVSPLKELLKSH